MLRSIRLLHADSADKSNELGGVNGGSCERHSYLA